MSDKGPVAKADKIFLSHTPMKGSQTRVKRHVTHHVRHHVTQSGESDSNTHHIKVRHRRESRSRLDFTDEKKTVESSASSKSNNRSSSSTGEPPEIFTNASCG